jgi:hypothetical protein
MRTVGVLRLRGTRQTGGEVCRVVMAITEGKRPRGASRCRWGDNIKMDLQEVGWGGACTGLMWLRIGTGGGYL